MITLTKKEFDKIYSIANKKFADTVYEYYRKNKFAMELCNDESTVKELFVYLMALSTYETSKFTDEYYINCITKEQIYSIFSKIKSL